MVIKLSLDMWTILYYILLLVFLIFLALNYYWFRKTITFKAEYMGKCGICLALLLVLIYLNFSKNDLYFINNFSKNMYLEGAVLQYSKVDMSYYEIQPNDISYTVNRIEKKDGQIDLLREDFSSNIFLVDCVKEINILNLIKLWLTYNILYLDDETYSEYLADELGVAVENDGKFYGENTRHSAIIELDRWMEDDMLDKEGQLN